MQIKQVKKCIIADNPLEMSFSEFQIWIIQNHLPYFEDWKKMIELVGGKVSMSEQDYSNGLNEISIDFAFTEPADFTEQINAMFK